MLDKSTFSMAAAGCLTSPRWLRVVALLGAFGANAGAQGAAPSFQPSRCVRDTTTARTIAAEVATSDSVAPGIHYRCLYMPVGPWALHVVSIDLRDRRYAIEGARALDAMHGREKVSDIARRLLAQGDSPVVAINADFFNLRTGEIENNTVIRGAWVKGVVLSDSAGEEVDNARTQFAVDSSGRPLIGRFELHGAVVAGASRERLMGINTRPQRGDGVVLYTRWFGARTPRDSTTAHVVELVLERLPTSGVETAYRVRKGSLTPGGGAPIPADGAVLAAIGSSSATFLHTLAQEREDVRITARLGDHALAPRTVVGGWPRLVVDGRNVAALADSLEGTRPAFSSARHPRSAIGISRDSSTLMLVVVDGRRPWSVGMSLAELADQLLALGAYQAMNLDGGGSSTLWVRGAIVNYPSDRTGERSVGNALLVVKPGRP